MIQCECMLYMYVHCIVSPFLLLVIPPHLFCFTYPNFKSVQAPSVATYMYIQLTDIVMAPHSMMLSYNTHWYSTSLASEARGYNNKLSLPPSLPPSPPLLPSLPLFPTYVSRRVTATKLRPNLLEPSQLPAVDACSLKALFMELDGPLFSYQPLILDQETLSAVR